MFGSSKDKHKNKAEKVGTEPSNQPQNLSTESKQADNPPNQSGLSSLLKQPSHSSSPKQSTPPSQPVQSDRKKVMETLISESCKVEGNIISEQSVKVDGKVEGSINVKQTLIISTKGQVVGNIIAESLVVYGHLTGDSQLKEIHIQDGGHIDGNIKTQSLKVDPNATYNGVVTMTKESLPPASTLQNKKRESEDKTDSLSANKESIS